MAHGWALAVALQTEPHLVQGTSARSGDNVFPDGLAAALTSIAEAESRGDANPDRQYELPSAGRPLDRIFPCHPPRVHET